jgi:hypothetical protein
MSLFQNLQIRLTISKKAQVAVDDLPVFAIQYFVKVLTFVHVRDKIQ